MLPETYEVVEVLKMLRDECPACTCEAGDSNHEWDCETMVPVRLQVTEGDWQINHGDPGYDQDHRGFWGETTIAADDDDDVLDLAAQQMLNEVEEEIAVEEEWAH